MDSSDEQQPVRSKIADQLVHYARMGDVNRMRQILRRDNIDVNHPSSLGLRPLSVAARHGHEKVARLLLEKGADARAHDTFGGRGAAPLHWATTNNHKRIVSMLLDAGADVSAIDFNGGTPLHDAARRGNTGVVSMLLAAGANPLARDFEGQTPRDMAATDETRTILRRSGILSGTRPSMLSVRQRESRESRTGSRSVSPRRKSASPVRSPERPQSSSARISRYSGQLYDNLNRHQSVQPQGKNQSRAQRSKKLESHDPSSLSPFEKIITHYHNRCANSPLMNDPYNSVESESFNSESGFPQTPLVNQSLKGKKKQNVRYNLPGEADIISSQKKTHNRSQNVSHNTAKNIAYCDYLDIAAKNAEILHFSSARNVPVKSSVAVNRSPSRSRSPSPSRRISQADCESLSKFCDEFIHQSILMSSSRSQNLTPSQYLPPTQLRTPSPTHIPSLEPTLRTVHMSPCSVLNRARSQSPPTVTTCPAQRTFPPQTHTIYNYEQVRHLQEDFTNKATPSNAQPTCQSHEDENRKYSPPRVDFMNTITHSPIETCCQQQSQHSPPQCSPSEQCNPCPFIVNCNQPCNQINYQPPISTHMQLSDVNSSPVSPLPSNVQASQFVSQVPTQPIAPISMQPLTQPTTQSILQTFTQPVIQRPTEHISQNLTPHYNKISIPTTNQTITQPLNQGFMQFPNQSSNMLTHSSLTQPINHANTLSFTQPSQHFSQSINQQGNQTSQAVTNHSIQPTYQPAHMNQHATQPFNYPSNASTNSPYNQSTYLSNTQPVAHLSIQPISQPFRVTANQTPLHPTTQSFTLSIGQISPQPEASSQPTIQTFTQISTEPTSPTPSQFINPTFDQKSSQPVNQPSPQTISKICNTKSQQNCNQISTKTLTEPATPPLNQQYSQCKDESSQPQPYQQALNESSKQTSHIVSTQLTQQPSSKPSSQTSSLQPSSQTSFQFTSQKPIEPTQQLSRCSDTSAQPDSESCEPQSHSSSLQLFRPSTQHVNEHSPQPVNQPLAEHHNPSTHALSQSSTYPQHMSSTQAVKNSNVQPPTPAFTYSKTPLSQSSSHPLIHSSTQTLSLPTYQHSSPSPSLIPIHSSTRSVSATTSPTPSKHSPKYSHSQHSPPHSQPPSLPPSERSSQAYSLSSSSPFSPSSSPIHSHTSFPSRTRTSPHVSPVQSRSLSYSRQFHPRVFLSKTHNVRSNLFLTQQPSRHSKQKNIEFIVEQKLPNYDEQSTKKSNQQTAENTDQQSNKNDSQQNALSQHTSEDIVEEPSEYCKRHSQNVPDDVLSDNLIQINPDLIYEHIRKVAEEQNVTKDDPAQYFIHHHNTCNENDNSLTVSQSEESDAAQNEQEERLVEQIEQLQQLEQLEQIVIQTTSHHAACPRRLANFSAVHGVHKCAINAVRSSAYCSPQTSHHSHRSHSSTLCAANKAENERLVQEANFRHALQYQDVDSSSPHPVVARHSQSQSGSRFHPGVNVYLIPSKSHQKACPHAQYNEQHSVSELVELASTGREEDIIRLLSSGMNIDKLDPKMRINALHLASRNGHITAVTTLLRFGANIECENDEGVTALHWASSNGHARVVHTLLKAGAKVDPISKQGRSPLHEAAAGGHAMVVNLLLQAGADPCRKDKMMLSPMDIATGMIHSTLTQHAS